MNRIFPASVITAAVASALTLPAGAQQTATVSEPEDSLLSEVLDLSEVVVTGTRTPRMLKDSPVQTRLISAKEIRRTDATDISSLLQQAIPGVEFSYAMNQQVHLNFGGFGGQSVLFLVDGERLAGETMDDVDFSRIDMAGIDHIEIVRGASSALYGSNAGGGVINIITRKASVPWSGNIGFRIGKHNSRRYTVSVLAKGKHIANTLSATASRIDSYDVRSAEGAASRVFTTVYGDRVLNVKDRLQWSPIEALTLTARAGFNMRELPRENDAPDRYRSCSGGLKGEWAITEYDRIELSYGFDQYDKSQLHKANSLDIRSYSDVLTSVRAFYTHAMHQDDIFSAGSDFSHEYLHNDRFSTPAHTQDSFDAFMQYDWRILGNLEAVGALRYDFFSEGRISRVTPKISFRYSPLNRLTLRGAWGMGFRAPTLKEKYYEFDMAGIWTVKGNPSLKPEQSHNVDISAEYVYRTYSFTAAGFYNRVRDRIATSLPFSLPGAPNALYLNYINLTDYSSAGCELSIRAAWDFGLRAGLSYAYTHERDIRDTDGNRFNNQYMPTRPHSLTVDADWSKVLRRGYEFSVSLTGRWLSGVDNLEYRNYYDLSEGMTEVHYHGYSIWKLTLSQTIADLIRISLTADNLFNYKPKYYYLNSPLTDGLTLMAGIEFNF